MLVPFGDTKPLLNISRHSGIPYERVLRYADFLIHGRLPPGHKTGTPATYSMPDHVCKWIENHVDHFNNQRRGF